MFAISAAWAVYVFGSHYGTCRADGTGELFCFVIALFFGSLEVMVFVIVTLAKLLMLIFLCHRLRLYGGPVWQAVAAFQVAVERAA